MKAAVHTQFGAPHVLRIEQVAQPVAGPGQILVQVHASPVTQGDRRLRAADFPGLTKVVGRLMFGLRRPKYPIPGTNFAGRVVAVGEGVTRFAVGDDVFGGCDHSAQAEYLAVAEQGPVAKIPAGVEYAEAAAVPYGAVTALMFLRDVARVQPGERVLIIGASGGVGRFAVQIARHLGAHVTGVCSGRNVAMVTELGAHEVIDHAASDYLQNGQTYDVIFDTNAGDRFRASRRSLTPNGRYVTVYLNLLVMFQMLATAVLGGRKVSSSVAIGTQELTHDVAELLAAGVIWPVVTPAYPFARIVDAHRALETDKPAGTVVVAITDAVRASASHDERAVVRMRRTA
ncbi:NAD(P)-dependent alcohol dehydrogenase [Enhygromyxa salina]|uniref:Phenolphthiocerol synthesis polyketide synthase type I Pks15 n=1 Tax=Enhygromyxa salina TaxID=215803 RepID=A0A2S9XLA6_9BACT|nr:NAD(P)-dependent alcohol dehydrogenase [Enhygromyxa salina]PRP93666.1 Phenolphthiocerol synthesis polyketide synthase type I Pks15 [Enhygromyxa salina]